MDIKQIERDIVQLSKLSGNSGNALDAMQFSQAAQNLSQALFCLREADKLFSK